MHIIAHLRRGFVAATALAICLMACGGDTSTPPITDVPTVRIVRIDVTPDTTLMGVGQDAILTATPRDSAGNALVDQFVQWTGNEPAGTFTAKVSPNKLTLTALLPGKGTIFATIGKVSGSAYVQVH